MKRTGGTENSLSEGHLEAVLLEGLFWAGPMPAGGTLTVSEPECLPSSVPKASPPWPVRLNGKSVELGSSIRRLTSPILWASSHTETFLAPASPHRGQGITCLSHKGEMDPSEGRLSTAHGVDKPAEHFRHAEEAWQAVLRWSAAPF